MLDFLMRNYVRGGFICDKIDLKKKEVGINGYENKTFTRTEMMLFDLQKGGAGAYLKHHDTFLHSLALSKIEEVQFLNIYDVALDVLSNKKFLESRSLKKKLYIWSFFSRLVKHSLVMQKSASKNKSFKKVDIQIVKMRNRTLLLFLLFGICFKHSIKSIGEK